MGLNSFGGPNSRSYSIEVLERLEAEGFESCGGIQTARPCTIDWRKLRYAFWQEFEPCASGPSLIIEDGETRNFAIGLNYLAGMNGYAQLV